MEGLLKRLVYVKFEPEVKSKLDASTFVESKLWKKYCEYQAEFKDRVAVLRSEKRDVPVEEDGDKIMPNILQTWTGNSKAAQPAKNYLVKTSCAFDKSRIDDYEKRNLKFARWIEEPGHKAAKEIVPLLISDIAFIKSFDVQWKEEPAALATGAVPQDDDDEPEPDTSSWSLHDPLSVEFGKLAIPRKGKLPPHILLASAIYNAAKVKPVGAVPFCHQVAARVLELFKETNSTDMHDIMTRQFTESEKVIFDTGVRPEEEENDGEGHGAAAPDADDADDAADSADAAARNAPTPPTPPSLSPTRPRRAAAPASSSAETSSPAKGRTKSGGGAGGGGNCGGAGGGLAAGLAKGDDTQDNQPLFPEKVVAQGGGRKKQVAVFRPQPDTEASRVARRKQTERYAPPESTRVVVKKRKSLPSSSRDITEEPDADSIPVSEQSSRVMPGRLEINKRFPKDYMSSNPRMRAPIRNMTLSSLWHAVSNVTARS